MSGFQERFEGLIDKQIREAAERGAFDDLPGQGEPLPNTDRYTEDWWLRDIGKREDVGPYALPVPLALRREAQNLLSGEVEMRSEAKLREAVADYNERADKARRQPHTGPSVVIPTVDADAAVAAWRKRREG
jgi:Domain of unknown function (DUF1992)